MGELNFALKIKDDWPPVSRECLPCTKIDKGYRIDDTPLFVKGLSVGDIIEVKFNRVHDVIAWKIKERSKRTTIWLLRLKSSYKNEIENTLVQLRLLHCNTGECEQLGCYSVDVPEECDIEFVDEILSTLDY